MSKFIKVKTHKRSLHKNCGQRNCTSDAKITAVMKTGSLVMDVRYCLECAIAVGLVK